MSIDLNSGLESASADIVNKSAIAELKAKEAVRKARQPRVSIARPGLTKAVLLALGVFVAVVMIAFAASH